MELIVVDHAEKTPIENETDWPPNCSYTHVENRTEPRTAVQWIKYLVVAIIALFLVWWMVRVYVLP